MEIAIDPLLHQFVQEQLTAGHYSSIDELVNSAIALLRHEAQSPLEVDDDLRRDIQEGIEEFDRGEAQEWDPEALWEEVERLHAERTQSKDGACQDRNR